MSFTINQPQYQGPLEVLLSMIEDRKLSISDISLALVADEFMSYITSSQHYPIGQVTSFVWVASTLVLIKAKSLLPTIDITTEEQADIAILEDRLAQLAMVRRAGKSIEAQWGTQPLFRRSSTLGSISVFSPGPTVTVTALSEVMNTIIGGIITEKAELEQERLHEVVVSQTIRLEEVIEKIHSIVTSRARGTFLEVTQGVTEKRSLIVTFLALLEMARQAQVTLAQTSVFSDIEFSPYHSSDFVGDPDYQESSIPVAE
jgi:segregation and condensation protein A